MRTVLFFILYTFLSTYVSGQTLILTNNIHSYNVSNSIQYSIDSNSNNSIDGVRSNATKWQLFKNGQTPNFGIKKQAYWFTFNLQNNSDREEWLINVDLQVLDSVSMFVYDIEGKLLFSDTQGILTQNSNKQAKPTFLLSLKKDALVRVYMRVKTNSFLLVPVQVSTPMAFLKAENAQRDLVLAAIGILLAALFFNILLLISSKEKAFVYLSLSIAFVIFLHASINGLIYEYINLDTLIIYQRLRFVSAGLTYAFHAIFVIYYLNLKNYKILLWVELCGISYFFLYSFFAGTGILSAYFSGFLLTWTGQLFLLIQFPIAFYLTWKKAPMARYYLFSFIPLALFFQLLIAQFYNLVADNPFVHNSGLYASALFTLLLTSGLTEKIIKVKHETARADQLEIDKIALEAEITQRINAEDNLRQSETRFHNLFELSPLPVMLTESETGIIVDANLTLCDYTGFQKEAIIGKKTYEMGFVEKVQRDDFNNEVKKKKHVLRFETMLNIKGKPRVVHLFMSLINIGNEDFILTLILDITDQKETEKKLKELNITKDKFLSIIAHDLVNPFHAMILYSKELKVFTANNERASSYNANLLLTAQNTYNLLQNLLTWTRAQTNLISFKPQPVNLGDLIAEAVANASTLSLPKQIEIINESNQEILIELDVQMISLVLRNLVSNSIKFSFNQGSVKITTKEDENFITISVIDNGIGMETYDLDKVFNLDKTFQQPGTAGEAGTGLGLVICNEFINYHKGSIHVESEKCKGSTFRITLPKKQK